MKRVLAALILGWSVGGAVNAEAAAINTAYRIAGDSDAQPVQVFDDGRQLFVQLRDVRQVPIPIGPSGPLDYTMKGHYMVLPLLPTLQLRWQASIAYVRAEGAAGGADPGGVVSMTRPVEATDFPPPAPATYAAPPPAPSPVYVAPPIAAPAPTASQPTAEEVVGEIEVLPAPGQAVTSPMRGAAVPAGASDGEIDRALSGYRGRIVIAADGTVAGASAARRVHARCGAQNLTCHVAYNGADRGTVKIEES